MEMDGGPTDVLGTGGPCLERLAVETSEGSSAHLLALCALILRVRPGQSKTPGEGSGHGERVGFQKSTTFRDPWHGLSVASPVTGRKSSVGSVCLYV